jgi:hypothetical protein
MKASEKKSIIKHIDKDSKEFKNQLKEDRELKKRLLKSSKSKKKKG